MGELKSKLNCFNFENKINLTSFDRIPSSESGLLSSDQNPVVPQSGDVLPFVEVTNTGIPVVGTNPNWPAYEFWTELEADANAIKSMACNQATQ